MSEPRPTIASSSRSLVAKRVLMAAATAFIAANLWTGAPLLALWIGSQVVGEKTLSMGAIFVVVAVLAILLLAMTLALAQLNSAYDRLTGRPTGERRLTWLRSMNTQARETVSQGADLSALERIVMASVYLGVIAFVI